MYIRTSIVRTDHRFLIIIIIWTGLMLFYILKFLTMLCVHMYVCVCTFTDQSVCVNM